MSPLFTVGPTNVIPLLPRMFTVPLFTNPSSLPPPLVAVTVPVFEFVIFPCCIVPLSNTSSAESLMFTVPPFMIGPLTRLSVAVSFASIRAPVFV